jgi:para-aminobenzoate synthetase component I
MASSSFTIIPYKKGFIEFSELAEGFLYHLDRRVCLITGIVEPIGIDSFWSECESIGLNDRPTKHHITHLFYEAGLHLNGLDGELNNDEPLAIHLVYDHKTYHAQLRAPAPLFFKTEKPLSFSKYKKSFSDGMSALKRGDCYQFNLTQSQNYSLQNITPKEMNPCRFVSQLWSDPQHRGAYANASYIGLLDMLLVSNSPECLFQVDKINDRFSRITSMPIKGTIKNNLPLSALTQSKKNLSELNIITDLIRNDLSKIERPLSRVISAGQLLKVPGLIHRFSRVEVKISSKVSLCKVLKSLFPGGSVTGAPKKRVLSIIKKIETDPRGFYCGSTLIRSGDLLAASINIRSGYYWPSVGKLRLHAGGGITLGSVASEEFSEMNLKFQSVLDLLSDEPAVIEPHSVSRDEPAHQEI